MLLLNILMMEEAIFMSVQRVRINLCPLCSESKMSIFKRSRKECYWYLYKGKTVTIQSKLGHMPSSETRISPSIFREAIPTLTQLHSEFLDSPSGLVTVRATGHSPWKRGGPNGDEKMHLPSCPLLRRTISCLAPMRPRMASSSLALMSFDFLKVKLFILSNTFFP